MADILFVTWDGGGNVPPALGIAGELARRGHRTRFLGHAAQEDAITQAGHGFRPFATAEDFVGSRPASVPRMARLFSDRAMGADTLAEVRREGADVVVVDAMLLGVLDAVAGAGLRYVSLEHLFDAYLRGGWLHGPMGLWGRLRRLRPVRRWDGADLALGVTTADLDPAATRPRPSNFRCTGPVLDVPPRTASFAERSVLVSLSTFSFPAMPRVLQNVVDATAGLDARVVVTTGPAIDPGEIRVHDRVELHRYVDHDELMPGMSLVVGHGGHATTMRALAHDLPMVLLPLHPLLDQPIVARSVQDAGAGRALRRSASTDQIRGAVTTLLEDGPHRAAAARLGARIRDARGTETAAAAVEELLSPPAPARKTTPRRGPLARGH